MKALTRSLGQLWDNTVVGTQLTLQIAQVGYEYEKNHAFQPGLPIAINIFRFGSGLSYFSGAEGIMTVEASFLIAGACVTNAAFVLAAVVCTTCRSK